MKKRGRPAFKVTPALRREVEQMKSVGETKETIARAIGCSVPTLEMHFALEIDIGGSRRRREVVGLLYKSARNGNVAAQKKLEEMTSMAISAEKTPEPKSEQAEPLGKKEQANREAQTAHEDTSWGTLLN